MATVSGTPAREQITSSTTPKVVDYHALKPVPFAGCFPGFPKIADLLPVRVKDNRTSERQTDNLDVAAQPVPESIQAIGQ